MPCKIEGIGSDFTVICAVAGSIWIGATGRPRCRDRMDRQGQE